MLNILAAAVAAAAPVAAAVPPSAMNPLATSGMQGPSPSQKATDPDASVMAGDPLPPRGMDVRDIAIDAPEWQFSLAKRGPMVVMGAFGGNRSGMPKLAHLGIIWKI